LMRRDGSAGSPGVRMPPVSPAAHSRRAPLASSQRNHHLARERTSADPEAIFLTTLQTPRKPRPTWLLCRLRPLWDSVLECLIALPESGRTVAAIRTTDHPGDPDPRVMTTHPTRRQARSTEAPLSAKQPRTRVLQIGAPPIAGHTAP